MFFMILLFWTFGDDSICLVVGVLSVLLKVFNHQAQICLKFWVLFLEIIFANYNTCCNLSNIL